MPQSIITTNVFGDVTSIDPISPFSISGCIALLVLIYFAPVIIFFGLVLGFLILAPIVIAFVLMVLTAAIFLKAIDLMLGTDYLEQILNFLEKK